MKKAKLFILIGIVAVTLALSAFVISAALNGGVDDALAFFRVSDQERAKLTEDGLQEYVDDYDSLQLGGYSNLYKYVKGKPAKIAALKALNARESGTLFIREAEIIAGKLPEGQARLTLEKAQNVVDKLPEALREFFDREAENYFIEEFDKIAGACDEISGSGIVLTSYYISDDGRERIVLGSSVVYINQNTGEYLDLFPTQSEQPQIPAQPPTTSIPDEE